MNDGDLVSGIARGHLLRILGVTFGVAVAVGSMIGAGVLRAPAAIAGTVPDATIILALWVLGGVHVLLSINVLAEFGTAVPRSGGVYLYAHRSLGDVAGLVVGWSDFLSKLAGIAATSIAFSEFLPLVVPGATAYKTPVAILLQIVLYAVNAFGLREGRTVQEISSLVKALLLLVFMGAAVIVAAPSGPVSATMAPSPDALGWAAIIGAYALVKGAYAGYSAPIYFTEENAAPSTAIPRALLAGVALTACLYVGVNAALLYALSPEGVASTPLPFNLVLNRIGGPVPGIVFAIGAMVAVAGVSNANIMMIPRMILAMSRDGLLPRFFQYVNRGGNPDAAMLLVAAGSLALTATGSFALVFGLIALMDTVVAVILDTGFFVMRAKEPRLQRPFRAWAYPWLPALLLAIDAALLFLFAGSDWTGLAFAAGLSILCVPFAIVARRAGST